TADQDKNAYKLQHFTVYTDTRPTEPEQTPVSADIGPNPYKGLAAFQETDADRFFGRERVTRTLWDMFCALHKRPLDDPGPLRLLAILGPSGSGKSSVARAGLLPELAAQPLPGAQRARVAVLTPGTHPLDALALMLARIDTSPQTLATTTSEFTKVLNQETDGQWEGLRRIADTLPDIDTQPLILLIDQFEEVYAKDVKPGARRQFLDNLLWAAADPSGRVSVILTLRSDFLGQTQSHPAFNQAITENAGLIPVMNAGELRQAIAKPAEHAGHALDVACVDLLIEQTHDRAGALPLLQFALTRIWDGLVEGVSPTDTLTQIGGVGGALAGEAQRLYDRLSADDQRIARRAFLALVQLGEGTRDTRRRISMTDIVAQGEESVHVQAVVRGFADPRVRLVTLSAMPDGTETAEVTHEALLDHWETLREWLDANREDLRFHRHLEDDARYWEAQGKPDGKLWQPPDLDLLRQYQSQASADMTPLQVEFFESSEHKERHSKRVRRMAVTALVVLTVFAIGTAGLALLAYNEAERQKVSALNEKAEALRLYHVMFVQSLVTYADQHYYRGEREQAALLARQAYFLNDEYQAEIEEYVKDVLQRILVLPEEGTEGLIKQVCRQATRNLTPDEWKKVVKNENIPYKSCPGLPGADGAAELVLRLRREPMNTEEFQHLSLYVKA
ncbi:MAG: ATP-binding protein, partial [Rhodobacteraceae bacterium]|nr:ATP-binding protein [Paracoccaceae bacterium]